MHPTGINPFDQSPPDIAQLKPEAASDIIWHSPVGIFTSTPDGRYTFANPATARIYGYPSPAELIASISDISSQIYADPTERETFQRQLREEGELINHEYQHRRRDGSVFWVSLNAQTIYDEHGNLLHYQGYISDITERKHMEEALRESEEKYRLLFNTFPLGITVSNQDGKIIETNAMATNILRVPKERHEGRKIDGAEWRIIRPDGTPMPADEYASTRALKEQRMVENIEMGIVQPDAGITWLSVTAAPLNLENYGVVVTYADITERRMAEGELRERESLFKTLVNTIPDLIWLKDANGVYLSCNKKFEPFFGASEAEILGKTDYDFVDKDQADFFRENDLKAIAAGGPISKEEQITFADDGHVAFLDTIKTPMFGSDGKLIGVLGIGRDITERRQAEEALRESEQKYRALVKGVPCGIVVHADDSSIEFANSEALRLLGLTWEQILGKVAIDPAWCFVRENGSPLPVEEYPVSRVLRTKTAFTGKIIGVLLPDRDDPTWALCNAYPHFNEEAQLLQVIVSFYNITELKNAENERQKLQEQLQQAQKMESVGRLAGGVAHDFNNMLGVIFGHTEMALEDVDPAAPLSASLQAIQHAAERSAALTRQLLAFARKQTVAPKVVDLNETVEGMLKMLRRLIGEDIELFWQPGEDLPPVKVDPAQLDQLLANLCVNARDAIAGVGRITIKTDTNIFDVAYCTDRPGFLPGEYLLLEVSDNGCGMDQSILNQIFEPFFTTKEQGKGTGLGLASVFGMVKQNNGFINVYSEPGQGTTFKIYLPAFTAKSAWTTEKGQERPAEHGHETILLVEDEPAILQMTTTMLTRLGYTVVAAATPGEAIRLAHEYLGRIDLLMTDVVMPEMNGRELAGNLLAHYPELKRLFMSGYTADIIAHHGVLDEGMHFIQKPFSMKDLSGKLRETLEE
ncbi:MAG: PAS domain S-box protein [Desulforhopalus sp.]|jgi:PAS domain S-box-containing protein|nr:PAS domain S-box protein [Desulforhopalus sp.]